MTWRPVLHEDGVPRHPHAGLQVPLEDLLVDLQVHLLVPGHKVEAADFSVASRGQNHDFGRKFDTSADEVQVVAQVCGCSNSTDTSCVTKFLLVESSQPCSSVVRASAWKSERGSWVRYPGWANTFCLDMILHCTRRSHWKVCWWLVRICDETHLLGTHVLINASMLGSALKITSFSWKTSTPCLSHKWSTGTLFSVLVWT